MIKHLNQNLSNRGHGVVIKEDLLVCSLDPGLGSTGVAQQCIKNTLQPLFMSQAPSVSKNLNALKLI